MMRLVALALLTVGVGLAATTTPAEAWWRGYGWRGYGWRPRVVVVGPPVVYGPPPWAYWREPRLWVPAHWQGGWFVPGHWR